MKIENIQAKEQAKYEEIWSVMDFSSTNQDSFFTRMLHNLTGRCLELGSGNGKLVSLLRARGVDALASDITWARYQQYDVPYQVFPVWDIPFEDNSFDYTFSNDLLEHLPGNMVDKSLMELARVTRKATIHEVATFGAGKYFGHDIHLTVKPITWWRARFAALPVKALITERKK